MFAFILTIHIIVCILMVLIVLLQQGKGAEVGAVFGSSEAIFGATGPTTFLGKATTVLAVVFMLTSLGLTYLSAHRTSGSVMESLPAAAPQPQQGMPAVPAPPPSQETKGEAKPSAAAAPENPAPQKAAGESGENHQKK